MAHDDEALDPIRAAYDPEAFRAQGHQLVDQLAEYLKSALGGGGGAGAMPVVERRTVEETLARWPAPASSPHADLGALVAGVLEGASHQHHPRYVGHQVSAPLPVAALCELAAALLNNGMAAYEAGPVSTVMERRVLEWMAQKLGWPATSDGVLTSGGSLGNLTALLAARQAAAGFDVWDGGQAEGPPLCVLAADQAHYSVSRAAQVMGWGRGGVVTVAVDDRCRMRADAIDDALAAAERAGRRPVALVASAGSTATGAIDPLAAIAEVCRRRRLWLHVDGAHGASALLSPRYRALLAGIERADSVVWDAHKLLAMPSLVTAVLFRDGAASYLPFAQKASYLFVGEPQWYNVGLRTLECTKRMMSLKLYAALSLVGEETLGAQITRSFDLTRWFAARLRAAGDFEVPVEPECNILCFRHVPRGGAPRSGEELDRLQESLRERVLESGRFYMVQTVLHGRVHLRTTLMSPLTREEHLDELIENLRRAAV